MRLDITNLSKLIKCPIILLDVVLSQPLDGLGVVHPLERTFRGLEVLQEENKKNTCNVQIIQKNIHNIGF